MKAKYAVLGMVVSFVLGATASQGLRAQTKTPALGIVEVVVSSQEAYAKEFLPPVTKTVLDRGGKFLAVGAKAASLAGAPPTPRICQVGDCQSPTWGIDFIGDRCQRATDRTRQQKGMCKIMQLNHGAGIAAGPGKSEAFERAVRVLTLGLQLAAKPAPMQSRRLTLNK